MTADQDRKADFRRFAIESLSSRLEFPTPKESLLAIKIDDLEIDSLDFVEWEIDLHDRFSFTTEVEFFPESDTVGEILDRFERALL